MDNLNKTRERFLIKEIKNGNDDALKELLDAYDPFIRKCVYNYGHPNNEFDVDQMKSIVQYGFYISIMKYDLDKFTNGLSTYATTNIQNEMNKYMSSLQNIPEHIFKKNLYLNKIKSEFIQRYGYLGNLRELSEFSMQYAKETDKKCYKLSPKVINQLNKTRLFIHPVFIDQEDENTHSFLETYRTELENRDDSEDRQKHAKNLLMEVKKFILHSNMLTPLQKEIMVLTLDLNNVKQRKLTQKEVAKLLNQSPQVVSYNFNAAQKKLRRHFNR